jgi:hypothetical protein
LIRKQDNEIKTLLIIVIYEYGKYFNMYKI